MRFGRATLCLSAFLLGFDGYLFGLSSASACPTNRVVLSGAIDNRSETEINLPPLTASLSEHLAEATASAETVIYDTLGTAHLLTHVFYYPPSSDTVIYRVFATASELDGYDGGAYFSAQVFFDGDGSRIVPDAPPEVPFDANVTNWNWSSGGKNDSITFFYDLTLAEKTSTVSSSVNGSTGGCPQYGNLDFDGDGKDDFAIFRPNLGFWAVSLSSTEHTQVLIKQWGLPGDVPVTGDFTGDGLADLAVWRPSNGTWYVCRSDASYDCSQQPIVVQFGLPGDVALEGDYTGDQVQDFAVWRPSTGVFYVRDSRLGTVTERQWGLNGDIPLDGGRTD